MFRWTRLAAVLVALVLVASACSNEGDDSSSGDTTTTAGSDVAADSDDPTRAAEFVGLERIEPPAECPAIPGIDDDEIRVGGIAPLSGPRATSFSDAIDGIKARFDVANEAGELGDRQIKFIEADDASDASRNAEAARTLVEQDDVYGIVEVSDQSDGSADYLHENGIPVTGWHVGRGHWGAQANFFAFRLPGAADPSVDHQNRTATVVKELGGTKAAIVGGGNESSSAYVNREVQAAESVGLEVVYSTTDVVSGNTEFTGIVQRIKESGADTLITGMDFLQNTALTQQLTDAGVEMAVTFFPGGYDPRVVGLPGVEGATFGLEFQPFESDPPAFAAFDAGMPEDALRNQITYIGWLSADMFIRGLMEADLECPTREAFITNLRLLDDWDGGGAFDPVDLNDEESWGPTFLCTYYVQVVDGAFDPMFDGELRCGDPLKLE